MNYPRRLLKDRGFTLKSVERDRIGYALLARRKNSELHVELKGVAGDTPDFIITGNEVRQASTDKEFRLIVVINALKRERRAIEISGKEFLACYQLEAVAYRAKKMKYTTSLLEMRIPEAKAQTTQPLGGPRFEACPVVSATIHSSRWAHEAICNKIGT
ncbi:MAG: DUF3883 domain-containing protein [Planctomycetota bacterium]|nr:DUF3883 domain-containing protein [Planctomycetota bacterium]